MVKKANTKCVGMPKRKDDSARWTKDVVGGVERGRQITPSNTKVYVYAGVRYGIAKSATTNQMTTRPAIRRFFLIFWCPYLIIIKKTMENVSHRMFLARMPVYANS